MTTDAADTQREAARARAEALLAGAFGKADGSVWFPGRDGDGFATFKAALVDLLVEHARELATARAALAVVRAHDAATATPAKRDAPGGAGTSRPPCTCPFPRSTCPMCDVECPACGPIWRATRPVPADAPVVAPVPVVTPRERVTCGSMCKSEDKCAAPCARPGEHSRTRCHCANHAPVPPVTAEPAVVPATVDLATAVRLAMMPAHDDHVAQAKALGIAGDRARANQHWAAAGGISRVLACTSRLASAEPAPGVPAPGVGGAAAEARRLASEPFMRLRRAFGEAWAMLRRDQCGTDFEDALRDTFTVIYNLVAARTLAGDVPTKGPTT